MNRRNFLHTALLAGLAATLRGAARGRPPRLLLYNGWQVENIGDVAHAPGILALLEEFVPEAEVVFWSYYIQMPAAERALLQRRFPRVRIVEGWRPHEGPAEPPAEFAELFDWADFFLHGSGPATVGWRGLAAFRAQTGKPFGVYGVTYGLYGKPERPLLGDAAFVYFRDSASLALARQDGVRAPIMEFGPDAAFAVDVRDDAQGDAYLRSVGLAPGQFMVCLPRHRLTPVWEHALKRRPFDPERHARNERMADHDHRPLREAITQIVRATDLKILIGHEDETQLPIGKTWVFDGLPEDVKPRVVWRDTLWTLDEAVSIYGRSAGMFSHEMHSPILCIAQGIPAIVNRWEEQSSKGLMWRDLGLGDWLFDLDRPEDVQRMPAAALALARDPRGARERAAQARTRARDLQAQAMQVLRRQLA